MRNLQVKLIPGMVVLLVAGGAALGQAQNTANKSTPADPASANPIKRASPATPEKPKPSELEQMLTEALVNNPDIRVAEAKLREAEAELNRVRLQVLQKVSTLHHAIQTQEATLAMVERQMAAARSRVDQDKTGLLLAQEKAKSASLQAELPAVLGRAPQRASSGKKDSESGESSPKNFVQLFDVDNDWRSWLTANTWWRRDACVSCHDGGAWGTHGMFRWSKAGDPHLFMHWAEAARQSPGQSAPGTMADKIHKALDRSVTIDIKNKSFSEALKIFEEKAPGVPFHTVLPNQPFDGIPINLHLEQVPLGSALQALEDTFYTGSSLRLAVRDYGILVTTRGLLPAGATPLNIFWKGHTDQEKPKSILPPQKADDRPPEDIEGVIKAIDPKSDMVTISIGSDAGLRKGHTLEVYRLKPEPKYLGSVRILSVTPIAAVAKPEHRAGISIEVGDRVTSGGGRR
jgi:hypothetical protein